jgi:outer membrane protein OmpA-like peptidoglycan-associated protein
MFNQSQIQGKFLECDGVTPVANATITVEGEDGPMSTTTDEYGVYKMVMPIERSFDLRAVLNGETIYEKKHTIRVLFRDQFDVDQNFYVGCEKNDETIYVKMINGFDLDPINLPVDPPSIEGIKPKVTEEVVAEAAPPVEEPKEIIAPVAVDKKIKLPNVFFDFDKHNIKSDFFKRLNEAAELLIENRELRVMVAGHTDAYGTNPYNVALGIRRYTEVYNYLISKGVDPSQLEVKTFSEDIPISTNRTIEGRAFNRRVELSFIEN